MLRESVKERMCASSVEVSAIAPGMVEDCEVVVIEVEVEVEAAAAASKAAFGIPRRGDAFGGRFGRRRS